MDADFCAKLSQPTAPVNGGNIEVHERSLSARFLTSCPESKGTRRLGIQVQHVRKWRAQTETINPQLEEISERGSGEAQSRGPAFETQFGRLQFRTSRAYVGSGNGDFRPRGDARAVQKSTELSAPDGPSHPT